MGVHQGSSLANKILVLNSGSSSLKWKLFSNDPANSLKAVVGGLVERIGTKDSQINATVYQSLKPVKATFQQEVPDHKAALTAVLAYLKDSYSRAIQQEVHSIGHRVVHGKEIADAVLISPAVKDAIRKASSLAPLHNPANLQAIEAAEAVFKDRPQVAIFDTAFHQTMPPAAYMYALPYELYESHHLRKYGFHGTSYKYLVGETSRLLARPAEDLNLIVCHLGAGASIAAIENGRSIDTSMGLTPLEGLVMATRSGDLDPAVVLYLADRLKMEPSDIDKLLNKKSGWVGLCGSSDFRSLRKSIQEGDKRAQLAIEVFVWRLRKYIGAYMVHLKGRVDAFVFSGGLGENAHEIRKLALADLQAYGIDLDLDQNATASSSGAQAIHSADSRVQVWVIPTDEELSIAQQTCEVVDAHEKQDHEAKAA
ncbi:hypothetical protein WJX72_003305 [[Myrmecia] bisecta]|uniref:Probable acetate kinase n=1 Tax=[Myrmecia] bisecta TaxID=41462 RepID=A0AAW1QEV4_9CHLO